MRIFIVVILTILSPKLFASGCMVTGIKGTMPGWNKPALVSSLGTSIAAFALSRESKASEDKKGTAGGAYIVPGIYMYLALMFTCRTISLEEYNKKKSKEDFDVSKNRWLVKAVPTKSELGQAIESWRKRARITAVAVSGINLLALSSIYSNADGDSTKNITLASALLTTVALIYDYNNIFSDKKPPLGKL